MERTELPNLNWEEELAHSYADINAISNKDLYLKYHDFMGHEQRDDITPRQRERITRLLDLQLFELMERLPWFGDPSGETSVADMPWWKPGAYGNTHRN